MKRIILTFALVSALCFAGCKPVKSIPGAINSFDGASYESLMVAQAALNTLKQDAPSIEPTVPQFKPVLNQAIQDYNIAEQAWQQYHAGKGSSAAVSAALATVATDILKVQGMIPTGGKQ